MMALIKTVTDLGDLAILLPLALVVSLWLVAIGRPRLLLWWLVAVALCMGSTAVLKIYFYVCPPVTDLQSPSGHTSFSTLVYGALTLALAGAFTGWRRSVVVIAGTTFIAGIGVSRLLVHAHSVPEVVVGSAIGLCALALFGAQFWSQRPAELRLRPLVMVCAVMMVLLGGQDISAEEMLHTIGLHLSEAGLACI
jgi:membrane-associated phospholipid phosphatase